MIKDILDGCSTTELPWPVISRSREGFEPPTHCVITLKLRPSHFKRTDVCIAGWGSLLIPVWL